jgi:3-oxoacyl-[acyl-carrier protein] reductase
VGVLCIEAWEIGEPIPLRKVSYFKEERHMREGRLAGKVAVITGGGNGIGKATALLFAKEGATIAVADFEVESSNATVKELQALGARAMFIKTDVSKKSDVQKMVDMTVKELGKVDIEANIAGITGHMDFMEITEERLSRMLDVHVKGTLYCMQAAAKYMIERKYGKIINTTSASGITGQSNNAHYSAAKAGIIGVTLAAAKALAPYEINVNAISPLAMTRLTETYPEARASLSKPRLMGRWPSPEDVARIYLFLASDDAACITGTILHANGGGHLMGAGEK